MLLMLVQNIDGTRPIYSKNSKETDKFKHTIRISFIASSRQLSVRIIPRLLEIDELYVHTEYFIFYQIASR